MLRMIKAWLPPTLQPPRPSLSPPQSPCFPSISEPNPPHYFWRRLTRYYHRRRSCGRRLVYRSSSVEWKPSPVLAVATIVDDSQVAAARAFTGVVLGEGEELALLDVVGLGVGKVRWRQCILLTFISGYEEAYLAYGVPRSELKLFSLMQKPAYTIGGHSLSAAAIELNMRKVGSGEDDVYTLFYEDSSFG
ncbi:hypothetical protein RHGRI_027109 [Rhododendron griersonianum]|uniref:Uncharacterized protein n=1 Tax=Rhododendron griersonianum TaxID=479676 RepID=A0AAV6J040_9ERIC|nr:hypothetical protein RHGRI_027109 [Rhododendron griersonianum]